MCLASRTAPPGERLRALVIGIPLLAVLTVLLLAAVVAGLEYGSLPGQTSSGLRTHVVSVVIDSILRITAPVMWILLLGPWELERTGLTQKTGARTQTSAGRPSEAARNPRRQET